MKSALMVTLCIMGMVIKDVFALQCLSNDSKTKLQATKTSLNNLKTSIDSRIKKYQKDMETKMKKLFDDMGSIQTDMKSEINKLVDDLESVESGCQKKQMKEYKGHCYFYGKERLTWPQAEQQCKQIGGHLAKIEDKAEHKWILDNRPIYDNYWMGLRDIKEEGFRWSADQTLPQYKPWYNWGPRDPKRNCGLLYFRDNIWLDHLCSSTYNYVCEVISNTYA